MKDRRGSLLWVLILILVILIVALAAVLKFMPKDTPPEPRPAVSRAKVPPLPTPEQIPAPQATDAATPNAEQKGPDTSPAPATMPSPQAKEEITTTDLKPTDTETPKPPSAETAAGAKQPGLPQAPPTPPALPPKTEASPAAPKNDSTVAAPTATPESKAEEEKQKEQRLARLDPDKMAPFTIQVGAYRNKANADEVLSQLTKKGYAPFIFQVTDAQQRSFYMVRFGHFGSREEAAKALDAFKLKEKKEAVIVRSGMM